MIVLNKELCGSILDIGGGGEGFIGRTYCKQTVAIDRSQEELDEAPDCCEKVLMDATDLKFESEHFQNVTFFYSLMYMTASEQAKAVAEGARVLKKGGSLMIWDCDIQSAYPDPFFVDVDVLIGKQEYHTTYGIVKTDVQDMSQIKQICSDLGLELAAEHAKDGQFHLHYKKIT